MISILDGGSKGRRGRFKKISPFGEVGYRHLPRLTVPQEIHGSYCTLICLLQQFLPHLEVS